MLPRVERRVPSQTLVPDKGSLDSKGLHQALQELPTSRESHPAQPPELTDLRGIRDGLEATGNRGGGD